MKISFNLRVGYNQALNCIEKIQKLGGDGNITVGGSWYEGTEKQIDKLLKYMGDQGYDMGSLAINANPGEAKRERIKALGLDKKLI